jgi:hypothetical protein
VLKASPCRALCADINRQRAGKTTLRAARLSHYARGAVSMLLPLAVCAAGTSSCITLPMLRDLAMRNAKDIDGYHRFGSPSEITAVNGHVVAVRHHETWFIFEISRKVSQERLDRSSTVCNLWVVLPIVIGSCDRVNDPTVDS